MKKQAAMCVRMAVAVVGIVMLGTATAVQAQSDFSRPIEVRNSNLLPGQLTAERIDLGTAYKPSLARLPDGELIIIALFTEGTPQLPHEFSKMARSSDNGHTWSAWQTVESSPGVDLHGKEQYLQVFDDGIPGNDDVLLATSVINSTDIHNTFGYLHALVSRSTDGGLTWEQTKLGPVPGGSPITQPSRNIIQMPDGTLLMGAGKHATPGNESHVYTSNDLGVTWQAGPDIVHPTYTNYQSTTIPYQNTGGFFSEADLRLNNAGELVNVFRLAPFEPLFPMGPNAPSGSDQPSRMMMSTSPDAGVTWTDLVDVGTPSQEGYGQHYMHTIKLADGRLMMTFTKRSVNQPLGLRAVFSHDDGETWDFDNDHLIIDQNTPAGFASGGGYGGTIQMTDGSLISTYSYHDTVSGSLNYQTEVVHWSLPTIIPDRTWNLDGFGDWNAANWITGVPPNAITVNAIFAAAISSSRTVFTDSPVTVKGITFGDFNTSTIQESYTIAGNSQSGSVNLDSDTSLSTISVLEGSHQFQVIVNLTNATDVDMAAGTSLAFNNALNLGGHTLTKTGDGTMNVNNVLNTGGGSLVVLGGALGGSGVVDGDLTNSGATVAPGNSPGTLSVGGDYMQTTDASLEIEIGGLAASAQHDVLVVGGIAELAGMLDIVLLPDFEPALGDRFSIFEFAEVSGTFDSIHLPSLSIGLAWDDSSLYSAGSLSIVPEPTSIMLLGIALSAVGLRRRRPWPGDIGSPKGPKPNYRAMARARFVPNGIGVPPNRSEFSFRFNLRHCIAVYLILLSVALPTEAAVSFLEDFEGPPAPAGTIDALGWGQNSGSVLYDAGVGLATNVTHAPASNTSTTKPFSGSLEDTIVLTADMYLVGVYDAAGGEGMVGFDDGTANYSNTFLVGPNANPANPGYPVGAGGWLVFDGLNSQSRINITTGGAPGVGPQFKGIGSGTVQVEMTIDQIAATISVDIFDLAGGASLNPTWVMPLTSGGLTKLANVNSVMMSWNDVHPGDVREIDNIKVVSGVVAPEPTQTWAINNSGDWNVGGNWSLPGVPNSGTALVGFGDVITSPRTVSTNASVTVNGIVFGDSNASTVQQSYTIAGSGSVTLAPDAGSSPSITVLEGSHQFQTVAMNLIDAADVAVATGASLVFNNAVNLNGNTLTKAGAGTMSLSGTVSTGLGGSLAVVKGVANGTGTVNGTLTNLGGTVAPGNSPGKLSVVGNYLQTGGSLRIEIDGMTAVSQYDVLDVTGDLTISGGSLDVVLGFAAGAGDSFDILNFGTADLLGATLNLDTLPANLAWDSSQLSVDGSLSVIAILPTLQWASAASGDWNSNSNWTPIIGIGTVPNSNVEIAVFGDAINSPRTVVTDTAVTVKAITFGDINPSTVQQSYNVAGSGSVTLDSDTNSSTVSVLEGSHEFQVIVNLNNATTVETAASSSLIFNNALNLNGNDLTKTGPGTLVISNALATSGGSVLVSDGTLTGNGTVGGDVNNSGGTLSPGNSAGMISVSGDYVQTADASLEIEIGGLAAGSEHDVLAVDGTAALAGVLDIVLWQDFEPAPGDHFSIFEFATVDGSFDLIHLPALSAGLAWDDSSLYSTGSLSVVPEPSLLLLVGITLIVAGLRLDIFPGTPGPLRPIQPTCGIDHSSSLSNPRELTVAFKPKSFSVRIAICRRQPFNSTSVGTASSQDSVSVTSS